MESVSTDDSAGTGPRRRIPVSATPPPSEGPPTVPAGEPPAAGAEDDGERVTVFTAVGGQPFFDRLVARFYDRVAGDEVLLSLYPDQVDLGPARERLALFLGQYWGGPPTYSERRGHPRLRMRHNRFAVGEREKAHWLEAMSAALGETVPEAPLDAELAGEVRHRMEEYFEMAASHLVNTPPA